MDMKRIFLYILGLLVACARIDTPQSFSERVIETRDFKLYSLQKITNPNSVYKIYIEGDGYAFNAHGRASADPTPKGILMRKFAFGDNSPNVIYLARPCQYVNSEICSKRHWTTARFAPEVTNAEYEAIKQIVGENPVILIGFSGGAQVAGLVASAKPDLNVKKIITIAGNLDHLAWTNYHGLPALNESMNLENYRKRFLSIPQIHYIGSNDDVIPSLLIKEFIQNHAPIIEVSGATHNEGFEEIYPLIWAEN